MPAPTYSSKAIVLSKEAFGESDYYVQFLTQNYGVISTLAKAAKKSKRRYVGGLDIFCHDQIFLRGDPKERPYLVELSVLNPFTGIRDHLEKVMLGGRMIQWVKKIANVAEPIPRVYSLLGQCLALTEKENNLERLELLWLIFKLKLISELGIKPRVDNCSFCAMELEESDFLFDLNAGGMVCGNCAKSHLLPQFVRIDRTERHFIQKITPFKLSDWSQVDLGSDRIHGLHKVIQEFAMFHTHTTLPL